MPPVRRGLRRIAAALATWRGIAKLEGVMRERPRLERRHPRPAGFESMSSFIASVDRAELSAMRHLLSIALSFLTLAAAPGDDKPIPQDTARMEQRSRDRLEWNRRTLAVAYDKVGKKDPRWDGPAREALELAARMFSQQVDPVVSLSDIHGPAKKAVDAGCKDPMILYLYARTSIGPFFPKLPEYQPAAPGRRGRDGGQRLFSLPPGRGAAVHDRAEGREGGPHAGRAARGGAWTRCRPRPPGQERRGGPEERGVGGSLVRYPQRRHRLHRRLGCDYKAAFDRVDARLAKIAGIEGPAAHGEGEFLPRSGAGRRGASGSRPRSPRSSSAPSGTRLGQARDALNKAWKAKPDEPNVADLMLSVEKSIGGGDREAMETWFERAMKAERRRPRSLLVEARLARPQVVRGRFVGCDHGLRQGLRRDQELADRDHPARRRCPPALLAAAWTRESGRCT